MLDWVHAVGSWFSVVITAVGILTVLTLGRRFEKPIGVATVFAVLALAGGTIGMAMEQRKVDAAFQKMSGLDLALRVKMVSVGTREASDALLVGGGCALTMVAAGALMSAASRRRRA
jgi:hypothetical protein